MSIKNYHLAFKFKIIISICYVPIAHLIISFRCGAFRKHNLMQITYKVSVACVVNTGGIHES